MPIAAAFGQDCRGLSHHRSSLHLSMRNSGYVHRIGWMYKAIFLKQNDIYSIYRERESERVCVDPSHQMRTQNSSLTALCTWLLPSAKPIRPHTRFLVSKQLVILRIPRHSRTRIASDNIQLFSLAGPASLVVAEAAQFFAAAALPACLGRLWCHQDPLCFWRYRIIHGNHTTDLKDQETQCVDVHRQLCGSPAAILNRGLVLVQLLWIPWTEVHEGSIRLNIPVMNIAKSERKCIHLRSHWSVLITLIISLLSNGLKYFTANHHPWHLGSVWRQRRWRWRHHDICLTGCCWQQQGSHVLLPLVWRLFVSKQHGNMMTSHPHPIPPTCDWITCCCSCCCWIWSCCWSCASPVLGEQHKWVDLSLGMWSGNV